MVIATSVLLGSCAQETKKTEEAGPLIGRAEVKVENGILTPEVLYSMARVSDAQLSPDGKKVLYGVTFISVEQNKGNRELFVMNADGTDKKQITETTQSEQNAVWIKGGSEIAFLSNESGSSQLWVMNADGSNRRQVSKLEKGMNAFAFSPDESKVLYIADIKSGKRTVDVYADLPKATGRIVDDLLYKHWDEWVETVPHPFIASVTEAGLADTLDIMEGEPFECPMKPNSGIEDLSWSPDGKQIAYASRKKTGKEYALSTNSDIYIYNVADKTTRNLTEGMMGYDIMPQFSPDGKSVAWVSQERDGYE